MSLHLAYVQLGYTQPHKIKNGARQLYGKLVAMLNAMEGRSIDYVSPMWGKNIPRHVLQLCIVLRKQVFVLHTVKRRP